MNEEEVAEEKREEAFRSRLKKKGSWTFRANVNLNLLNVQRQVMTRIQKMLYYCVNFKPNSCPLTDIQVVFSG